MFTQCLIDGREGCLPTSCYYKQYHRDCPAMFFFRHMCNRSDFSAAPQRLSGSSLGREGAMPRQGGGQGTCVLGPAGEKRVWLRCWRASKSQRGQGTCLRSHSKLVAEPGAGLRAPDSQNSVSVLLSQSGLKPGSHNLEGPLCA